MSTTTRKTFFDGADRPPDDQQIAEDVVTEVYEVLRAMAIRQMANEPSSHTLQPTALVHEAFLRLQKSGDARWENRAHYLAAAATAMRRILIERARRVAGPKRGGDRKRVILETEQLTFEADAEELIHLDEALDELETMDPRMGRIIALRFFVGLTVEETAIALDLSPRTVKREWACARAWLYQKVTGLSISGDSD